MQKLYAMHIMGAVAQMERVEVLLKERKKSADFDANAAVSPGVRNFVAGHYARMANSAEAMGATITAKSARRAVRKLRARKTPITFAEMGIVSKELGNVLVDEVGSVELYCLKKGAGAYYSPEEPLFGESVENKIPKAADDISEAGKCFAVGRYTASAFHLMRAMETAVQEISSSLGISNVQREWGKLLSDIAGKIELMPKGDSRDEWSAVHANLYHVKQAWRNNTMHPKRTYTEEEAREVFDAMKAFMRHLTGMLP